MQLPMPFRAVVGLAAEAVESARHLPDRAIELPMLAVSTALQMSLRAQQRYAMLAARGDEVINRREPGDEPPPWATFDDEMRGSGGDPLLEEVAGDLPDLGDAGTKPINGPRNGTPSRFDVIGDE